MLAALGLVLLLGACSAAGQQGGAAVPAGGGLAQALGLGAPASPPSPWTPPRLADTLEGLNAQMQLALSKGNEFASRANELSRNCVVPTLFRPCDRAAIDMLRRNGEAASDFVVAAHQRRFELENQEKEARRVAEIARANEEYRTKPREVLLQLTEPQAQQLVDHCPFAAHAIMQEQGIQGGPGPSGQREEAVANALFGVGALYDVNRQLRLASLYEECSRESLYAGAMFKPDWPLTEMVQPQQAP